MRTFACELIVEDTRHMTEYADVKFKVDEFEDGTPYLGTQENGSAKNKILHDKMDVSLHLKPGTSFEEAKEIEAYLNAHIAKIAVTLGSQSD